MSERPEAVDSNTGMPAGESTSNVWHKAKDLYSIANVIPTDIVRDKHKQHGKV
jgi:hypothetical protein